MRPELQSQNRVNGDCEKIKTKMGVAGLMFEPRPPDFENLYNF